MAEAIAELSDSDTAIVAHSFGASATLVALAKGLKAQSLVLLSGCAHVDNYPRRFCESVGLSKEIADALLARVQADFGDAVIHPARALPKVETPALVVHDVDDAEVPYLDALEISEALADARLVSTAGLGHRRGLADRAVIKEVCEFLAASA